MYTKARCWPNTKSRCHLRRDFQEIEELLEERIDSLRTWGTVRAQESTGMAWKRYDHREQNGVQLDL